MFVTQGKLAGVHEEASGDGDVVKRQRMALALAEGRLVSVPTSAAVVDNVVMVAAVGLGAC